jgi:molybdenum cofactor synthesis domain-containing protein
MTPIDAFEKRVHPMVTVPDAIRTVLGQTALKLISEGVDTETISLLPQLQRSHASDDWQWKPVLGRRIAHDVVMSEPGYPANNASIMDGYAIHSKDVLVDKAPTLTTANEAETWTHAVVDKIYAGRDADLFVNNSSRSSELPIAYYITTGAVLPDNCDCVVPIEECQVSEDHQRIAVQKMAKVKPGTWVRQVGCDIPAGSVVLPKGHCIDSAAIGLLLQANVESVTVQRSIRVGVLSTGNELLRPDDEPLSGFGKIPDVNRPILLSLLSTFETCTPVDLGIQRDDDIASVTQTLRDAITNAGCDVIVTTGGISRGESDVMEQILVQHLGGTLHMGRMHMKPGKPTTFVTMQHASRTQLVFALPGNPVSGVVCAQLLLRPCLQLLWDGMMAESLVVEASLEEKVHLMVQSAWVHPETTAVLSHDVKLDVERPEYHRVKLSQQGTKLIATSTGVQQSSRLMSLRDAEGLLLLPQAVNQRMEAKKGEEFTLLLLKHSHGSTVKDSLHLNSDLKSKSNSLHVAVIQVTNTPERANASASLNQVSAVVKSALSGSKSGAVEIISEESFAGDAASLFDFCAQDGDNHNDRGSVDVFVIVCNSTFRYHLDVATELRHRVRKVADALALQARQGAASECAASALLETVVGYVPTGRGSIMIMVPELGLQGALANVRGLLKHALEIARGKAYGA